MTTHLVVCKLVIVCVCICMNMISSTTCDRHPYPRSSTRYFINADTWMGSFCWGNDHRERKYEMVPAFSNLQRENATRLTAIVIDSRSRLHDVDQKGFKWFTILG